MAPPESGDPSPEEGCPCPAAMESGCLNGIKSIKGCKRLQPCCGLPLLGRGLWPWGRGSFSASLESVMGLGGFSKLFFSSWQSIHTKMTEQKHQAPSSVCQFLQQPLVF